MRKGLGYHNRRSPFGFNPGTLFAGGAAGAWYDPSDASTLFSDTAGTTPSPTPGAGALSVVGKMLDKSGNGNHAISYNTTTARPELSARVNLLTYSEAFGNAAWNTALATKISTTETDPNGGSTASLIQISSGGELYQDIPFTAGLGGTFAVYVKKPPTSGATAIRLTTNNTAGWNTGLSTKVTLTSDWQRVLLTGALISSGSTVRVDITCRTAASTVDTDCIGNVLVAFADLRPANIGTSVPSYQRIADAYTYDSSGFPRYLVFNGTASGMYTPANLNLSGTDKATVFAGVRKQSDAAQGVVVETSANATANSGSLFVAAPNSAAANYAFLENGGGFLRYTVPVTYAAPISNVLSCGLDLATATLANSVTSKVNAVLKQDGLFQTGQTTGNFGTYPLNIGCRSATATPSLFFNGYIYSLIVVGAASTAAQITSTESWINVKEGGVY